MSATGLKIVGTGACLPWCSISSSFENSLKTSGHDINVSPRAAGFNLNLSVHVFFTLKDSVPIDWHYMTDRLQRFWLLKEIISLLSQSYCSKLIKTL